jgi:hypothetical protein
MKTWRSRSLIAISLVAALSGGCRTTPAANPPSGDDPSAEAAGAEAPQPPDEAVDDQQVQDGAREDQPSPPVGDLDCRRGVWTAC